MNEYSGFTMQDVKRPNRMHYKVIYYYKNGQVVAIKSWNKDKHEAECLDNQGNIFVPSSSSNHTNGNYAAVETIYKDEACKRDLNSYNELRKNRLKSYKKHILENYNIESGEFEYFYNKFSDSSYEDGGLENIADEINEFIKFRDED